MSRPRRPAPGRHAVDLRDNTLALNEAVEELRHSVIEVVRTSTADVDRRQGAALATLICQAGSPIAGHGEHAVQVSDLSEGGACLAVRRRCRLAHKARCGSMACRGRAARARCARPTPTAPACRPSAPDCGARRLRFRCIETAASPRAGSLSSQDLNGSRHAGSSLWMASTTGLRIDGNAVLAGEVGAGRLFLGPAGGERRRAMDRRAQLHWPGTI